jgi:hypothetical protein
MAGPPPRASRLVVPHIRVRRDPKLFMQESPVLAETFRVNSSAGPSGPRRRRDCNTGKLWPLCMNRHSQWELDGQNTITDARDAICFTLLNMWCCTAALKSACKSSLVRRPSATASHTPTAGLAGLGSAAHLPPRGPRVVPSTGPPRRRCDLQP